MKPEGRHPIPPRHRSGDDSPERAGSAAGAAVTPAMLEAQYQSMRESLEAAVEVRLDDFARARGPIAASQEETARRLTVFLPRFRPELYLLVTLVLFGLLWFRGAGGGAEEKSAPSQAPPNAAEPKAPAQPIEHVGQAQSPSETPFLTEIRENPDATWERLVADHRKEYARELRAVARAEGLDADAVSDLQKRHFEKWAAVADGSGAIPGEILQQSRTGLFEYVYGLAERSPRGHNSAGFKVTLDYAGYDQAVFQNLLRDLRLESSFEAPVDPRDPALQDAVLARRLFGQ